MFTENEDDENEMGNVENQAKKKRKYSHKNINAEDSKDLGGKIINGYNNNSFNTNK